jgi:hypothetical protein
MNKVKLRNLLNVTALTDSQVATQIGQLTGQHITVDLLRRAADGAPVSAIVVDAILKWLSQQMGREITLNDISDLRIHPFSALPSDAAKTEEGQQEMLAHLRLMGYQVTPPPALEPEPMYQEGDYLKGDLAPKNWQALANRRVPWPANLDPKQALHEMAPFMTFRLLSEQAAFQGRDINALIRPEEDI